MIGCGPAYLSFFFSVYHRVNLNWIQHIAQDERFFLIKDQDCALVCQLLSSFVTLISVGGQHRKGATRLQVALAEWCDAVVSTNSSAGKLKKIVQTAFYLIFKCSTITFLSSVVGDYWPIIEDISGAGLFCFSGCASLVIHLSSCLQKHCSLYK